MLSVNREKLLTAQPTQSSATAADINRMSHFRLDKAGWILKTPTDGRIDLAESPSEIGIGLNGFRYDREDRTGGSIAASNASKVLIRFRFSAVSSCVFYLARVRCKRISAKVG